MYSSWGYDQTNVDFYQVVEIVGLRGVRIRRISEQNVSRYATGGTKTPEVDCFMAEAILKRASVDDTLALTTYSTARKLSRVSKNGVLVYPAVDYTTDG